MLIKRIRFAGILTAVVCDGLCNQCWGINSRPKNTDGKNAPAYPGTYEGGQGKPIQKENRLNKWCIRESERAVLANVELNVLHEFEFPK